MILGVILYFIFFIFLVPYWIYKIYGLENVRYYLPIVDLIAISLATLEKDRLFDELYSRESDDLIKFLSANIIHTLALIGIVWQTIYYYDQNKNLYRGIQRATIMIIVTYLLPLKIIPYVINHILDNVDNDGVSWIDKLLLYIVAVLMIILFVSIELFLIKYLVEKI